MTQTDVMRGLSIGCLVLVSWTTPAIVAAQDAVPPSTTTPAGRLVVGGDIARDMVLVAADFAAMPRRVVTLNDHGTPVTFEGVPLFEILKRAGAPLGADLRGPALATYVLATASDGYQVVFSAGELDPDLAPNDVIVADRIGGAPLDAHQGPWRIVVPGDKRPARSLRMLERLDVVRLRR